jgi:hypothetical protein
VGFVVDKVALGQGFSDYFGFPCQFSFYRLLHTHHLSSGAGTIGQLLADVCSKWTQSHPTPRNSLMELSPSREAANCAATRELPSSLWNPEIHHRIHICPPSVPILSQIDPIHTIPSYLSKIHFNIVYPSTSWSSQWELGNFIIQNTLITNE